MHDLPLYLLVFLIMAAFAAGFVDSIAGGGGLITIPALLIVGFPPVAALGTNKLQGLFGSGSATLSYARAGHVNLKSQWLPALLAALGSGVGAYVAASVPGEYFRVALPLLLIAIALYFAFKPNMNDLDRTSRMTPLVFTLTFVPFIGAYDGIFGPGAGSFYMLGFVSLAGYGVLKATAHTKLLNFSSNVAGFAVFAAAGVIAWKIGLIMGVAQFIGAQVGSRLAMKKGAGLIKPLLVITCAALAIRLLSEPDNPVRVWLGF